MTAAVSLIAGARVYDNIADMDDQVGEILVDAPMTLRAKAIRYGYKESAEVRVTFTNF